MVVFYAAQLVGSNRRGAYQDYVWSHLFYQGVGGRAATGLYPGHLPTGCGRGPFMKRSIQRPIYPVVGCI